PVRCCGFWLRQVPLAGLLVRWLPVMESYRLDLIQHVAARPFVSSSLRFCHGPCAGQGPTGGAVRRRHASRQTFGAIHQVGGPLLKRRGAAGVVPGTKQTPEPHGYSMNRKKENAAPGSQLPPGAKDLHNLRMCQRVACMPAGRAEAGQVASPRGRNVENEPAACRDTLSATGQNLRHERRRQVHEQMQTENGVELETLFRKLLC